MDYAKDIRTGKIVNASEVEVEHRREFSCPKCDKLVHIVKKSTDGRKKPHFAHNKGEGTTDCENYHSRSNENIEITNLHPTSVPDNISQQNPNKSTINYKNSFHLEIVLTNPTLKTPHWHLAIAPTHNIKTGYVEIENGLWGKVRQPLSTTSASIPVKIQEQDYQIEITDTEFKGTDSLSGLSLETGNLFTHNGNHGCRLTTQKRLGWGEKYFLVWHKNYQIECPAEIRQRALISQENWECVEIQLPQKPSDAIRDWAQHDLEKQIQTPAATLSLVTPPINEIDDNTILIKNTDHVIVAVTDPLGNNLNAILLIEHAQPKTRAIRGKSPVFIELGRLTLGKTTLQLSSFSSTQSLVLNCVLSHEQKTRRLPSAILLNCENRQVPAYSMEIYECLQTRQHNPFIDIDFPTPMRFRIWHKSKNDLAWQVTPITICSDESQELFQKRAKQAILEFIEHKHFIKLDFGHFGQPFIQQPTFETDSESESRLPKKVVQQIQWLANLAPVGARTNQPASREGVRMLNKIPQGKLNRHLQQMNRAGMPAIVEPYLRVLAKKLSTTD
jgi:hypothetical protein